MIGKLFGWTQSDRREAIVLRDIKLRGWRIRLQTEDAKRQAINPKGDRG